MSRIFRFALQNKTERLSERWTFFWNNEKDDVYAVSSRMSGFAKISFHASGKCHVKSTKKKGEELSNLENTWKHNVVNDDSPAHLMRIVYPLEKLNAKLPLDKKVNIHFDEIIKYGSLYLDIFKYSSDKIFMPFEGALLCCQKLHSQWIVATLLPAPSQLELPERTSEMRWYLGEPIFDDGGQTVARENTFITYLSYPENEGIVTVSEISWLRFPIRELKQMMGIPQTSP